MSTRIAISTVVVAGVDVVVVLVVEVVAVTVVIVVAPDAAATSEADGKVSTSSASDLEIGYLVGVTDSIQNQLDSKANQATTYTTT